MTSPCRHYRSCSGCSSLTTPYAKQLRDKGMALVKTFSGLKVGEILNVVPSPSQFGYRSSTKLCLDEDNFGRPRIGLYQQQSKTVVDIPDCPVHEPGINKLVARLLTGEAATRIPAPFYQHGKRAFQPNRLKFLTLRNSSSFQAAGIILSHTGVNEPDLVKWAKYIATDKLSVYATKLSKDDETRIIGATVTHLAGPKTIPFTVAGRTFHLSPLAFFQANQQLVGEFVTAITTGLSGDTLLDLYGGFGAYSYAVAEKFKQIYLVDGNIDAIEAAAAQPNAPSNIRPIHDSVENFLARHAGMQRDRAKVSDVIINPPRGGISTKVSAFFATPSKLGSLKSLTYVSCNPQTLVRDMKIITKSGQWQIDTVQPFDMFPQTEHVEVVAKLSRR